jgi:hypothetical protein
MTIPVVAIAYRKKIWTLLFLLSENWNGQFSDEIDPARQACGSPGPDPCRHWRIVA